MKDQGDKKDICNMLLRQLPLLNVLSALLLPYVPLAIL